MSRKTETIKAKHVQMQVNKYIHPAQIIPQALKDTDIESLRQDYNKPENFRIRKYLEQIDNFYLDRLIVCGS